MRSIRSRRRVVRTRTSHRVNLLLMAAGDVKPRQQQQRWRRRRCLAIFANDAACRVFASICQLASVRRLRGSTVIVLACLATARVLTTDAASLPSIEVARDEASSIVRTRARARARVAAARCRSCTRSLARLRARTRASALNSLSHLLARARALKSKRAMQVAVNFC